MLPQFLRTKRLAKILVAPDWVSAALYVERFGKTRFVRTLPMVTSASGAEHALNALLRDYRADIDAVELKLSSCLVQFVVCNWPQGVWKSAEIQRYAQARVREIYGNGGDGEEGEWVIAVDRARFQEPCLVAAVKKNLLDKLVQTVVENGLLLHSITPVLMDVLNHPTVQNKKPGWLHVIEPETMAVALCQVGVVQQIRLSHWRDRAALTTVPQTIALSMGKLTEEVLHGVDASAKTYFTVKDAVRTSDENLDGFEYMPLAA